MRLSCRQSRGEIPRDDCANDDDDNDDGDDDGSDLQAMEEVNVHILASLEVLSKRLTTIESRMGSGGAVIGTPGTDCTLTRSDSAAA